VTSPTTVLRDAFERHTWSTLALLGHLEALDPAAYDRGIPGTYGPIPETLTHLVDADTRYLDRMDDPNLPTLQVRPPRSIGDLRTQVQANASRWSAALDRLVDGDLHASIGPKAAHPNIDPAETLLLLQALHHADDHRAQVCSTLGALGLDVPELDVWSFWGAERRDGR
jgi:uncharacterized damage-inducible protein DinB